MVAPWGRQGQQTGRPCPYATKIPIEPTWNARAFLKPMHLDLGALHLPPGALHLAVATLRASPRHFPKCRGLYHFIT